jgi:hypothetical protein
MPKVIRGKPVDEEKWNRAKTLAAEQGHSDDWDYIVAIYKRLAHLDKSENDVDEISKKVYSKNRIQLTLAKSRYFTTSNTHVT